MEMYKLLVVAIIVFCGCFSSKSGKNNIKGVKVRQTLAVLSPEAKITGYDTNSVELYYAGNSQLYRLNYQFDSSFDDVPILSEDREHFAYCESNEPIGYDSNIHKLPHIREISIDSLRKSEWAFRIDVYSIFTKATTTLIASNKNVKAGTLNEEYEFRGTKDTSMTGTCYLTYTSSLKNIEYSLCQELDSAKKMKLIQVRIVSNPRFFKPAGIYLEMKETTYSLEEIKIADPKNIEACYEVFRKVVGTKMH